MFVGKHDPTNEENPIGSMYGIYTYIWLIFMVNVGEYTIHGSYGNCSNPGFFFGEVVGCDLLCKAFAKVIKSDSSLFVGT